MAWALVMLFLLYMVGICIIASFERKDPQDYLKQIRKEANSKPRFKK
jgi:hypothetical protein